MNVIDRINTHRYLYLTHISEPEENALRLVITGGRVADEPTPVEGLPMTARPIAADGASYEIVFDRYIAYAVLNESYSYWDESETFEGRGFRVYSESKFLSYVRAASIATDDYPGPYKHYGIVCLNHIVDVASTTPPHISVIHPV